MSLCGIVESDKEAVAKFRIDVVRTVKNTEDAYYSLQRLKAGGYIPPSLQFPPPYVSIRSAMVHIITVISGMLHKYWRIDYNSVRTP